MNATLVTPLASCQMHGIVEATTEFAALDCGPWKRVTRDFDLPAQTASS